MGHDKLIEFIAKQLIIRPPEPVFKAEFLPGAPIQESDLLL
jgi:hypothetical protein